MDYEMIVYGKDYRDDLIKLLSEKGIQNLFIVNNLRKHQLGKDIHIYRTGDVYIMNWMDTSIVMALLGSDYPIDSVLEILSTQHYSAINGPKEALSPLESALSASFGINYKEMMKTDKKSFRPKTPRNECLRELFSPEDWEDLYDLYLRTPEYSDDYDDDDKEEWALSKAEEEYPTTGVGLYQKGRIVSGAYLAAATSESAMVVGVATDPDWRSGGLATSVVSELTDIALFENNINEVALWYSNDLSKHIYMKLGYQRECDYAFFKRKGQKK